MSPFIHVNVVLVWDAKYILLEAASDGKSIIGHNAGCDTCVTFGCVALSAQNGDFSI